MIKPVVIVPIKPASHSKEDLKEFMVVQHRVVAAERLSGGVAGSVEVNPRNNSMRARSISTTCCFDRWSMSGS